MKTRPARAAFTLIEVMMAMAIMLLLAGAIFGTVKATLEATAILNETQLLRRQTHTFFDLCRQTFATLPAASILVWGNREEKGGFYPEIILREAPRAFVWGPMTVFAGETALGTRAAPNGSITLGVELREMDPFTGQPKPEAPWLPLLNNLQKVAWKFYDARTGLWQEFWNDPNNHPSLITLTLIFTAAPETEWTQTFWLPPLSQISTGEP